MQKFLTSYIIFENSFKANKKDGRTISKDVIELSSLQTE